VALAPGDLVRTRVTASAPHHLIADAALAGGPFEVARYAERRPEVAGEGGQRRPKLSGQAGPRARPLRLALSPRR
jgi:tRNA-2-methylthio-N6-dimethylallyladenosine synthase